MVNFGILGAPMGSHRHNMLLPSRALEPDESGPEAEAAWAARAPAFERRAVLYRPIDRIGSVAGCGKYPS